MIYLGADHRGFHLKEQIKNYLLERGYSVGDVGVHTEEPVDYPIVAKAVAGKVLEDPNNRGVLLCGSGAGVCIVANKFDGIRAAQAWEPEIARSARYDDNINVLCLPADAISFDESKPITQAFLDTSFSGEERYKRRLEEIGDIEKDN